MRRVAALAALLTAMLLQGALVGPLTMAVPLSLPAVLVAAVALVDGPATGMSFGFTAGLLADLGSTHPAGVFALSWLGLGVMCGLAADRRTVRGDAVVAALCCVLAAVVSSLAVIVAHAGGTTVSLVVRWVVPVGLGDALLALAVIPVVRAFLRSDRLRAPRPLAEVALGSPRG